MADNECPDIPEIPEVPENIDELAQAAQESIINLAASGALKVLEMLTKSINRQTIEAIESVRRKITTRIAGGNLSTTEQDIRLGVLFYCL